ARGEPHFESQVPDHRDRVLEQGAPARRSVAAPLPRDPGRRARQARARRRDLHHAYEAGRDRADHARDRRVRGQVPSADAAEQPGPGVLVLRTHASAEELGALAPLAGLSRDRLAELAEVAVIERAPRGSDPLRGREPGRSLFLLQGELLLYF